ncbi:uncharacterized protein LOC134395507 [Elgaria multicarinata webbii]|uniref:uncharacterized protein LOC134395507 n=1 Tax=Elgaria multicarinata webbii TaxID=159646 RepID=UPI002FCD5DB5
MNSISTEPSSKLLWWKIGLGVSLAAVVVLTVILIVLSLSAFQGPSETGQMVVQHPVVLSTHLCGSNDSSLKDHFYKLPKKNSCTSADASCLSTPSEVCILLPKAPITAVVNETVLIPVEVEVPKSDWDFIEIQWHHVTESPQDLILKFALRSCSASSTTQKWWERSCILFLEVMPTHRWKKSVMTNAWLVIWNVQRKDAGRYQVTVKSNNMSDACSFVELAVSGGDCEESRNLLLA